MGAKVKLTVQTNFEQASKELRKFGTLTETETKRIDAALKRIKTDQLDAFVEKNKRAGLAITATRGKMAGLKSEHLGLQRKMEMLIRNGIDPQDKALQKLKAEYTATGEQIKKMETAQENLNKAMEAGKTAALAIGAALLTVATYGTKAYADYARELANVNTLIQMSAQDTRMLDDAVTDLSNTYAIQKKELGSGVYQAISAGASDLNEALVIVEESAKLGRAALIDNAQAVDIITTAMNAYGEEVVDAERASNVYFQTIKKGKINGEQLASTIGQSITLFSNANLAIEDLGAGVATLTKVGVKASEATTQLNAVVNGFIKPSEAMSDALARAGYESGSAMLEAEGLAGAMEFLQRTTGGSNERLATLLPNIRGMRGAMALMAEDGEVLNDVLRDFEDVTGATDEALLAQTDGIAENVFTVEQSIIAMQNLSMMIGEKVLPVLGRLAEFVVRVTTDFESFNTPMKILLVSIPALTLALGGFLIAMNMGAIVAGASAALGTLTGAVSLLGTAIAMNPIGAFTVAVAALGTAITVGVTSSMNEQSDAIGRWATAGADDYRTMTSLVEEYNSIRSKSRGDRSSDERARMRALEKQIEDTTGATLRYGEVQQTIRGVTETVTEAYLDQGQGLNVTAGRMEYLAEVYENADARRAASAAATAQAEADADEERARIAEAEIARQEEMARVAEINEQRRIASAKEAGDLRAQLVQNELRRGMNAQEVEIFNIEQTYQRQRELLVAHYGEQSELLTTLEADKTEAIIAAQEAGEDEIEQNLRERIQSRAVMQYEARQLALSNLQSYYLTVAEMEQGNTESKLERMHAELARINELETLTNEERLIAKQAIEDQINAIEQNAAQKSYENIQARFSSMKKIAGMSRTMFSALDKIMENSGKKSRAMAYVQKALAVASIALDTGRAIVSALADPTPMPTSLRIAQSVAVGAIGLAQGVAVATTPIPSAQTGGKFEATMDGTQRSDGATVAVNPGEQLEVTPRSEDSEKNITVINKFDENVFWESTQRGIDSGKIVFTTDNLIGA